MSLGLKSFDFNEMARLAKEDPNGFAQARDALIKEAIADSYAPAVMAKVQMELEATRYHTAPGLLSCINLFNVVVSNASSLEACVSKLENAIANDPELKAQLVGSKARRA